MIFGIRQLGRDEACAFGIGACNQDVGGVLGQLFGNREHLVRRLSEAEHDLGHAVPQAAVMVDFRKAQILKGHVPETPDGLFDIERSGLHVTEQFAKLFLGHLKMDGRSNSDTMLRGLPAPKFQYELRGSVAAVIRTIASTLRAWRRFGGNFDDLVG